MKLLFKIEKVVPARMPGAELAAYMSALARLLGAREYVHFVGIHTASTGIEARVGPRGAHTVRRRMQEADKLTSPVEVRRQWDEINGLLARRKTSAKLQEFRNNGTQVDRVIFPGDGHPELPSIRDHVQVQGVLYRIEGRDSTVHVGLVDGDQRYSAVVSRDQAKEIARTAMFAMVRVEGRSLLTRAANGTWEIGEIAASSIEPLEDVSLDATFAALRDVGGFGWSDEPGGLSRLEEIRSGE